jgi:hypothetical protein
VVLTQVRAACENRFAVFREQFSRLRRAISIYKRSFAKTGSGRTGGTWKQNDVFGTYAGPWTDPLKPSDGHTGFWAGEYNYGIVYGGSGSSADMVVAPIVTVLHNETDTGFSIVMDPADPGLAWGDSVLEGVSDNETWTSSSTAGGGGAENAFLEPFMY